ncbi:proteasome subunit beta type-7-like [Scaptodrosophila lebanonensis]|uniref:Proteasome subunit beta n=1 Tax=Drosophila lebanonensis TaxID=7225 RepID=A0A6J2UG12_DROLE|nr:proteasome subunit beta type-7-like [Scaptodrosophila lebanonensis]
MLPQSCAFNFDNCKRNADLQKAGFELPRPYKTGTSIVGVVCADAVVLGADTRATGGSLVADKNCIKIHRLMDHIYCCGAGTAADTDRMTMFTSAELDLHELNTDRQVPVVCASRSIRRSLFRFQGHIGAALVLGGVDKWGPQLYCIYPHGSEDKIPYCAMGSGTLAALAKLERGWRENLSLEEGKELVREAINAGAKNDLGSGSNIDLCVITKKGAQFVRADRVASAKRVLIGKTPIKRNCTIARSRSVHVVSEFASNSNTLTWEPATPWSDPE